MCRPSPNPEVLLHTTTHILETSTSNVALLLPSSHSRSPEWVTPRLARETVPFLDGVMRQHLLETGIIHEKELTLDDWSQVVREGRRVIGFNGLRCVVGRVVSMMLNLHAGNFRGVWEAELV